MPAASTVPAPPGPTGAAACGSWRPEHPPATPLARLAQRSGLLLLGAGDTLVHGVTHDSRAVRAGDLYAALPGARAHGADFLSAAVEAGATAVLTDPAARDRALATGLPVLLAPDPRAVLGRVAAGVYGDPAADLLLLGVTGTNGKTTTAYLLAAGLTAAGHRTGLLGTVETRVGDLVVPSVRTTPEATDLQALLAVMRERGVTAAALEISSHALALGRVDGLRVAVAGFTNLSQDHLDFHADLEEYFQAKAALFTPARAGQAVVAVDDSHGERLAATTSIPVETCSATGRAADWQARDVREGPRGSRFRLLGPGGLDLPASVALPGAFNVTNALLAVAMLAAAGIDPAVAVDGVAGLPGVPGRMERVEAGQAYAALVDYAHTPEAVAGALAVLRPLAAGRLLVVLGCGGDRDRGKRPLMGAAAVAGADLALLTSDNPRSEDPQEILAAMVEGARSTGGAFRVEPDRATAIALAVAEARPGDIVLVAGKGHEQGQELADGRVVAFDDRRVLSDAIRARGAGA